MVEILEQIAHLPKITTTKDSFSKYSKLRPVEIAEISEVRQDKDRGVIEGESEKSVFYVAGVDADLGGVIVSSKLNSWGDLSFPECYKIILEYNPLQKYSSEE